MVRLGRLLMVSAIALVAASPSAAEAVRHRTEYSVALAGFPIARASFSTQMDRSRYTISGNIHSAGIANLFTSISAQTTVNGTVRRDTLRARSYLLSYRSGNDTRVYDVNFRNGNVTSTAVRPEPKRNPDEWIPVTDRDLRAVFDPISGVILPGDRRVCPNTLPIFDGESRLDLVLSPKGSKPFSTDGFAGDAIVCNVRYMPKSGFKKGRSDIDYLKKQTMEIWFAKSNAANVYAPVYVKIPTRVGTLTISAVKFGN